MQPSRSWRGAKLGAVLVAAVLALSVTPALVRSGTLATVPASGASGAPLSPAPSPTLSTAGASAPSAPAPTTTPSVGVSPHPGTLQIYEIAPGGAPTVDPAVAYYTVDDEVISNVYEPLINYNGTEVGPYPGNFTPDLATCVPGATQCQAQFGNTLVYNDPTTGEPRFYTFEIDSKAKFYDPSTGTSWGVYPSDVVFSLARTMSFADQPFPLWYNGWIIAQALLPTGSSTWDGGIHSPYNNTPNHVLASMLVNNSTYCPAPTAASGITTHGCVTFDVSQSGVAWPYFLELIGDPLGGSITPCGAFTYLGAGLPGFLGSSASHGDGPCLLPGNATSTSQPSFKSFLRSVDPTAWDGVQDLAATGPVSPQPAVQHVLIGSGPYYATNVTTSGGYGSGGYRLHANPAYAAPQGCAGALYCLPNPGSYIPNVVVYWDNDDTVGVQNMISGQADNAWYDPSHTSSILQLVNSGSYGLIRDIPSGSNWFMAFELNMNLSAEKTNDPYATQFNIPTDFFSSNSVRQFMVHAYPYKTIEDTVWTVDGVQYGAQYGGAIPPPQGSYYPTNVSWPSTDPDTNPADTGGAAWWWAQATNPSSNYYDPELAACTPSTPCQFPIIGWVGAPSLDTAIGDWESEIFNLTGGALKPYSFDQTGTQYFANSALGNGAGNMPIYNWGWIPDYMDPTDYLAPMWQPNGTFTYSMSLGSQMYLAAYNQPTCGHNDFTSFTDLVYWANAGQVATSCQGVAYQMMDSWANIAAHEANLTKRALEYNQISHIGNELALMVYAYLNVVTIDYGSWISPSGINTNPSVGAGNVQTWYTWQYATNVHTVTFNEVGLASGTTWSVSFAGTTKSSSGTTITFPGEPSGTYPYSVAFVSGYGASPSSGTITIGTTDPAPQSIAFTAFTPPLVNVTFQESGLVSGTNWSVVVTDVGTLGGEHPLANGMEELHLALPAGTYTFAPSDVVGYSVASNTSFTAVSANVTELVTYTGTLFRTIPVTFASQFLPGATSWTVTVGTGANSFTVSSTSANITFFEQNNTTVPVTLTPPSGHVAPAAKGLVHVGEVPTTVSVPLPLAAAAYALTFSETGLAPKTGWNVTIGNLTVTTTTSSLVYQLPNGSYPWEVEAVAGYNTTTPNGTEPIAGAAANVAITFLAVTYAVWFYESGLPIGMGWTVTIGTTSVSSSSARLEFNLTNGTYDFTVGPPSGFGAAPDNGSFTISGPGETQVVAFGELYVVSFSTATLPNGTAWTVYIAGQSLSGSASLFNFHVMNGTWVFSIVPPSGYTAKPTVGQVFVQGGPQTLTVVFAPVPKATSPSSTYLSTLAYGLVGGLAALAVIGIALAAYFARRTRPPAPPPQGWSEGPPPSSGEGETPPSGPPSNP